MNQILLNGVSLNDLLSHIGQIIEQKLEQKKKRDVKEQFSFLSRKEVCALLRISLPTLNDWSKLGWLQSYKIGNRVLYKNDEVEASLHKVATYKFGKGGNHAS